MSLRFRSPVRKGSSRGKIIGVPTVNLEMEDLPSDLKQGIHACRCRLDDETAFRDGVLHYGPRPVFKDIDSCEIHLLDTTIDFSPKEAEVEVVGYIRPISNFPSTYELLVQINDDMQKAREMLE